jgi:ribosomal protein L18E
MAKFDGDRFKTQLKLAKFRLENLLKQHRNTSGGRRREIATLLQNGHEDRARVNVIKRGRRVSDTHVF